VPEENSSEKAASVLRSLLVEFGQKLDRMRDEHSKLRKDHAQIRRDSAASGSPAKRQLDLLQSDYSGLLFAHERLHRAGESFARSVSQYIEHSITDGLERIELQLRLADFEANLQRTQIIVSGAPW
jgi:hypothetical protein